MPSHPYPQGAHRPSPFPIYTHVQLDRVMSGAHVLEASSVKQVYATNIALFAH